MTDAHAAPRNPAARARIGALEVHRIAVGGWRWGDLDDDALVRHLHAAADLGMDLLDVADVYGTPFGAVEAALGRALAQAPELRGRFAIASKGGIVLGVPYDSSAAYLVSACEASLMRLGIERIDLYQIHRPDWLAHPAEVAEALVRLRDAGKIREAGVSNYSAAQFDTLQAHLPFALASHQSELSPLVLDPFVDGVADQCMRHGCALLAWSPLAGGAIADPRDARGQAVQRALADIASAHAVSVDTAALAFLLRHPAGVIPIVGTRRIDRLAEAERALAVEIDRASFYRVVEASRGARMP